MSYVITRTFAQVARRVSYLIEIIAKNYIMTFARTILSCKVYNLLKLQLNTFKHNAPLKGIIKRRVCTRAHLFFYAIG